MRKRKKERERDKRERKRHRDTEIERRRRETERFGDKKTHRNIRYKRYIGRKRQQRKKEITERERKIERGRET